MTPAVLDIRRVQLGYRLPESAAEPVGTQVRQSRRRHVILRSRKIPSSRVLVTAVRQFLDSETVNLV